MNWIRHNQQIPRIIIIAFGAIVFLLALIAGLTLEAKTANAQEATSTGPTTYSSEVNIVNIIPTVTDVVVPVIISDTTSDTVQDLQTPSPATSEVSTGITTTISVPVETTCPAVTAYLKSGWANDQAEMMKLQDFLRSQEGAAVTSSGVFDAATLTAVSAFQSKYANEVLAPWGISTPTGFVYITTKNKMNEIACGADIPLTQEELAVISEARANGTALAVATNGTSEMEEEDAPLVSTSITAVTETDEDDTMEGDEGVEEEVSDDEVLAIEDDEHATSTGALSTWGQRMGVALFAVPEDAQDLYKAGANIILILAVLAIAWLILREYVFYRKGLPADEKVNRTRLIFFAVGSLVASVAMAFSPTPAATLPLFALFVILLVMIFTQGVGMAPLAMQGEGNKGGGGNMQRNNMVPMKTENRAPLAQKHGGDTQKK